MRVLSYNIHGCVDRIALRGPTVQHAFRTDRSPPADIASDHRPLICDVEWRAGDA